jgi:hypothetical protein
METLGKHFRKLTETAMSRHGFAQADILSQWQAIAGERLASLCQPERIKWPRGENSQGGTLVLKAAPGRALDIQYATPGLIQKINQFFGFEAITAIKITQAKDLKPATRPTPVATPTAELLAELETVSDPALKASLARLGASLSRSPQQK